LIFSRQVPRGLSGPSTTNLVTGARPWRRAVKETTSPSWTPWGVLFPKGVCSYLIPPDGEGTKCPQSIARDLAFPPTRPTWSRHGFTRRRTGFPAGPCQNLTAEAACRRLCRPRRHPAPDRSQPDRRGPAEQDCEWNGGFEGLDPSPGCTYTRAETCWPGFANMDRSGRSGNPQRAAPPRRTLPSKHLCDEKDHDRTANASAEEQVQH